MKEIKDYLHLYLGSNCPVSGIWGIGRLVGIDWDSGWCMVEWRKNFLPGDEDGHQHREETEIKHVKPILRPLSDMTEEEKIELLLIIGEPKMYAVFDFRIGDEMHYLNLVGESGVIIIGFNPESVKYLLSKHFDLFGLIEAGLAIDKTVLK